MALRFPRIALPLLLSATAACASAAGPEPFSRSAADFVRDEIHVGINIGNTLDVPSGNETDWGNVPVTRELIRAYRAKGFDTVRIPSRGTAASTTTRPATRSSRRSSPA